MGFEFTMVGVPLCSDMWVPYMGVPPIAGWFIVENPNLKWMMQRGTPMT